MAAVGELRLVRHATLQIAEGLSAEHALKRVRDGTWSVAEVLEHILRTEQAFRKYRLQAMERARTGAAGTIRIGFREVDTRLRPLPRGLMPMLSPVLWGLHAITPFAWRLAVMRKPGFVLAAAPKVAEPGSARPLNELHRDLAAEMQVTLAMFEGELPEALPRVRVAHPLYGSHNMVRILQLMGAHEERHQYQLRSILRDLGRYRGL